MKNNATNHYFRRGLYSKSSALSDILKAMGFKEKK